MGESMPPMPGDRPLRSSERIDEACDRFEAAWRAGLAPRIEDFLAEAEQADLAALLDELVALERELRRRSGERPGAEEYLDRFPGHAAVVRAAFGASPAADTGPTTRPQGDTGLNLLFGVLALQNNFIGRDALLAAFAAWVADKARPMAQLLVDRGAIDGVRRALLEALVSEHLKQHDGDTEASLAAVSSLGSVRDDLERLGDADLRDSLAFPEGHGGDAGATVAYTPSSGRAGERFRILRFHREGGLGRVYLARDEELGRDVALKEIRPDKIAADLRGRFILEAEINGGLEHPGIVPVYSLGSYGDGRPFYAMRFVEGDSLKEAIESYHKDHPRPDPAAVEFRKLLGRFIDVCEAIAFAHSKGVLHRDLKPHNVMLGRFGETLLIDWGLAKATGLREPIGPSAADRETTLVPPSGSGHAPTLGVLGSPPYMSPEQAAGDAGSFGPATDVYGLGAILFALLTGEPPVEGRTTEEILDRVRRGAIRSPRSLNPNIPRSLEAVCLKALGPESGDRYPTALALAEEVEHWLADEPVAAWRERFSARARRWARRNRTLTTGVAVALLASVVGLSALAAQQSWAYRKLSEANFATTTAKNEAEKALVQSVESRRQAEAVSTFLVEAFRSPDPSLDGRKFMVADLLDRAVDKLDKEFSGSLATKGALFEALGETSFGLGIYNAALERHLKALSAREKALGADHPDTVASRNNVANSYIAVGRHAEAIALFETMLRRRGPALAPDDPDTLTIRNNLAASYLETGRVDEAIKLGEETLMLREAALGSQHPHTLVTRDNLANAYASAGRFAEAITMLEGTLKLRETKLGVDHPDSLLVRSNLANAYFGAGRHAETIVMLEGKLGLYSSRLGPDHPRTLQSRNNLALSYHSTGRTAEAIELHEETLKRFEANLGPYHPDTLVSRTNLAAIYHSIDRTAEAIGLLEPIVDLVESKLGPRHAVTLQSRNNLAACYFFAGRYAEAVALHEATLKLFETKLGPDHPYSLVSRGNLAMALESLGRCADAEPLRRDALARRRKATKPDNLLLAGDLAGLGYDLLKQAKWSEAEAMLRECLAIREKAIPNEWLRFNTMSQLGETLLGRGRYDEAERLIVQGYEGMNTHKTKIPAIAKSRLSEAAERILRLYEAWGKPEEATDWKARLEVVDLPADVFARP